MVADFIHNDFVDELSATFAKFGVKPLTDFDPCDPYRLRNPKLYRHDRGAKTTAAIAHHHNRLLHALDFLRTPVKFAAARHYHSQFLITLEELKAALSGKTPLTPPTTTAKIVPFQYWKRY